MMLDDRYDSKGLRSIHRQQLRPPAGHIPAADSERIERRWLPAQHRSTIGNSRCRGTRTSCCVPADSGGPARAPGSHVSVATRVGSGVGGEEVLDQPAEGGSGTVI